MMLVPRATLVARWDRSSPRQAAGTGLLLVTIARLILPIANTQAVERDPYHLHLVIGGTPAQRAEALAHHRHHDHDRPHGSAGHPGRHWTGGGQTQRMAQGDPQVPRVVSVLPGTASGAMVLSTTGLSVATVAAPAGPPAPRATGQIAGLAPPRVARVAIPVPDPPPRPDPLA
ncbi:MAG: hypothetical protein QN168_04125 [Armatimonadota bacterium]|nr:hypothetical protein [Armatimonadota bacterium]